MTNVMTNVTVIVIIVIVIIILIIGNIFIAARISTTVKPVSTAAHL